LWLEILESRTLLSFIAPLASDTGNTPRALAVGDFNGDGIPDIVTANQGDVTFIIPGTVSVLLGNGDGTFRSGQTFQTRPPFSQPWAVVVGEFDRDNKPDFAVIDNHDQGTVSVFLGNGDGTFTPAGRYVTSMRGGTTGLAAADLRGNGITDLIAVNPSDGFNNFGSVAVLLGNGDGTFQPAREFPAGLRPTFVGVGDFNGDGKPDLVVGSDIRGDFLSILLGNGDGTFQAPITVPGDNQASSVAVGDFDGDGKADFALAAGDVKVFLGNGDGTFRASTRYTVGARALSVLAADVGRTGKLDLVTGNSDGTASVLRGNGDGTFQAPQSYFAGVNPFALAVADFRGNGIRGLAVVNHQSNASNVTVLLGNGDGTFQSATSVPTARIPGPVAVGDFIGDGIADDIAEGDVSGVNIFLGNGDGTFQAETTVVLPNGANSIAVGDFNGDGILDLAATANDRSGNGFVWLLLGNGDGTFQAPVAYAAGRDVISLAVGRLRGKQFPLDLVVVNNTFPGTVQVLLGNGDGTFGPPVSYAAGPSAVAVAVGDFDGDGKPDLVVSNRTTLRGTVTVLLGNGDGTFQPGVAFEAGVSSPGRVTVGDLRGNGILDLVVAQTLNGASTNHLVSVLLGNGDGTFRAPMTYRVGAVPIAALVGDFGDGKADLAVANELGSTVSVLRGNGDGTFGIPVNYAVGPEPTSLAAGDFNGDGFLDLVTGNTIHTLSVLLNAGDGSPGPARAGAGRRHSSRSARAFRGDAVAALTAFLSQPAKSDRSLSWTLASQTVQLPLLVMDVERFFAKQAGERGGNASRLPSVVVPVLHCHLRDRARTDAVPRPQDLPALLWREEWLE
jgi:hypothetical protein